MTVYFLGNTISDIFGLGLAQYIEQFCTFIGIEAPDLTPTQQNMGITQRAGSFVCRAKKKSIRTFQSIGVSFAFVILYFRVELLVSR